MKSSCICYVTDNNYLFITLSSAIQARKNASSATDVILLSIDNNPAADTYRRICDAEGIVFLDVAKQAGAALRDSLGDAYQSTFSGRISAATLVRLIISEFLPGQYERLLYIDGDTQIYAPLGPLLDHPLPKGKFLAARDCTSVMRQAGLDVPERFTPDYDRLGLPTSRQNMYFNAGVIVSGYDDWKVLGRRAFAYFIENNDLKFHDQDALNGACWQQHLLLSSRWNFPRQFMHLRGRVDYRPEIIHFMANPKPWHGAILPWGFAEYRVYRDLIRRYPVLASDIPTLSFLRLNAYRVKSAYQHGRSLLNRTENRRIVETLNDGPSGSPAGSIGVPTNADCALPHASP